MNQELLPIEIIVIDNDKSKEVKKLCEKIKLHLEISLIYIESKENSLTVSKNVGLKIAKGDLVSFIDDDSTIDGFVETLY